MRGFIVEEVIQGCDCQQLSIFPWNFHGEDQWHDLTDLQKNSTVSSWVEMEGVCPVCDESIVYNQHFVTLENDNGMFYAKNIRAENCKKMSSNLIPTIEA